RARFRAQHTAHIVEEVSDPGSAVARIRARSQPQEAHAVDDVDPVRTLVADEALAAGVMLGARRDDRGFPAKLEKALGQGKLPCSARTAGLLRVVVEQPQLFHAASSAAIATAALPDP